MSNSNSPVKQFPCPGCGANLQFNPQAGKLKCAYCGWQDAIPQSAEQVKEHSYEEYLNHSHTKLATLSATAMEVICSNCGASVTFEPPHVAGNCPFCAAAIVAQPKLADPSVSPEGIVPFTIDSKAARDKIRDWLKSRWFAPKGLKQLAQQEKLEGVYLPYWTYDSYTVSHYRGERGDYYYVTETYTETNDKGEQETKTREVRHTRWHSVSGRVDRSFDDILIAGTKLIPLERLKCLEPWHIKESVRPYEPSYLAGFKAQRSQVSLNEGFNSAKAILADSIESDVRCDIGGDEQRVDDISTAYSAITFKYILLPVWMSSYRYRNKQYQVILNGQTGEILGDRPYSVVKITSAVLAVIATIGSVFLLFNLAQTRRAIREIPPTHTPIVVPSATVTAKPNLTNTPSGAKDNSFSQAVSRATNAATLAQSARTTAEWKAVVKEWEQAIALMQAVPNDSVNHTIAQKKITEYQKNLNYAQQKLPKN